MSLEEQLQRERQTSNFLLRDLQASREAERVMHETLTRAQAECTRLLAELREMTAKWKETSERWGETLDRLNEAREELYALRHKE